MQVVDAAAAVPVEPFAPRENVKIETDPKATKPGDDGFAHPGSDDAVGCSALMSLFEVTYWDWVCRAEGRWTGRKVCAGLLTAAAETLFLVGRGWLPHPRTLLVTA